MKTSIVRNFLFSTVAFGLTLDICTAAVTPDHSPLVIQDQGSVIAGGTVATQPGTFDPYNPIEPDGQTYHGDHVYAFYQIPVDALDRFLSSCGTAQASPRRRGKRRADGREGFQTIFLRRRFSLSRRPAPPRQTLDAARSKRPSSRLPDEQLWFNQFRIGLVAESRSRAVQFAAARQARWSSSSVLMTPNTGHLRH